MDVVPRRARRATSCWIVGGLAGCAAFFAVACGGDSGDTSTGPEPEPEPTTGSLEVSATTTGDTLDLDGYTAALNGADPQDLGPNGTVTFQDVEEGDHEVEITGIQPNCRAAEGPTRTATVTGGETATASFTVTCAPALLDRIVFASDRTGDDLDVYAMATDGSDVTQLVDTSNPVGAADVSSDGTRIAFSARTGISPTSTEIFVMDADGSNVTQVTSNENFDGSPTWSPDASRIAFLSDRDGDLGTAPNLFVMDADGTDVVQVIDDPDDEPGLPAWSPDGSVILFGQGIDGIGDILTVRPDGTDLTNLTNSADADGDPAWSPDGSRIVFVSDRDGTLDLYLMDADGANPERVTSDAVIERFPAWTPDGTALLYATDQSGDFDIHVVEPDGTGDEELTSGATGTDLFPRRTPARP